MKIHWIIKWIFILFIIIYITNSFSIKENLDSSLYPKDKYYNTNISCNVLCGKLDESKEKCTTFNKKDNIRCKNIFNQLIKPNCYFNSEKKCVNIE